MACGVHYPHYLSLRETKLKRSIEETLLHEINYFSSPHTIDLKIYIRIYGLCYPLQPVPTGSFEVTVQCEVSPMPFNNAELDPM